MASDTARGRGEQHQNTEHAVLGLPLKIWAVTAALVVLYIVVAGGLSVERVLAGRGALLDLGIFDQVAWNTAQGRLYWDTIDPVARHSFLGQHVSPALLITGALYRVVPWGGPLRLVVLQTLCLGGAALPLAWLAGRVLGPGAAPWIVAAYLLSPSLSYVNLIDFHEIVLAVPALALACAFLQARRWTPLVLCLVFALCCKEDMTLVVAGFGLYLVLVERGRPRLLGAALIVFAAVWALVVLIAVVPYYRGAPYVFGDRYAGGLLGSGSGSGSGVHLAYLASWWTPAKGVYLLVLLGPWLALPLLAGWRTLLCLAPLATSLLSTFPGQADYHNQYAAPFLPLGMACTVWALETVRRHLRIPRRPAQAASTLAAGVAVAAALAAWAAGPLPGARDFAAAAYRPSGEFALAAPLLARIPAGASAATVNRFGAYLSARPWLWHLPHGVGQAAWILVMAGDNSSYDYDPAVVAGLRHDMRYALAARRGALLLFRRRPPGGAVP